MQRALDWLGQVTGLGSPAIAKLILTLAIVVAVWIIRWVWLALTNRRTDDPQTRYRWRKIATYSLTIIGLILIGRTWLEGIQSLVTYLGLV